MSRYPDCPQIATGSAMPCLVRRSELLRDAQSRAMKRIHFPLPSTTFQAECRSCTSEVTSSVGAASTRQVSRARWRFGLVAACALLAVGCALNRAQVKSLRDPTATRIQLDAVVDTTISALNAIPSHCGPARN